MGIEAIKIDKYLGKPAVQILRNISINIQKGDFVSLCGRSGSGKSTLLYILGGLDKPSSGLVKINGKSLMHLSPRELHLFRNQKIGFVFQNYYLISELTALENVLMPALKSHAKSAYMNKAIHILENLKLSNKLHHHPHQLSGGEQQRVSIARALLMDPEYLLADEPTGNLDSKNAQHIMEILSEINQKQKTTIVLVTHDKEYANYAKNKIYLSDGTIKGE